MTAIERLLAEDIATDEDDRMKVTVRLGDLREAVARIRELEDAFAWIADLPEDDDFPDTLWGRFWQRYRALFPDSEAT